ncbi:hypothetical protein EDC01DRAFT_759043 [Geopyxis carbonaria]|nr:hypothetical protein EDC01DRAFT_759043 [Geopyxis carbonaria]
MFFLYASFFALVLSQSEEVTVQTETKLSPSIPPFVPQATTYPDYIPTQALNSMATKWAQTPGYSDFINGFINRLQEHVATQTHVTLANGPPEPSKWLQVQTELQDVAAEYVMTYSGTMDPAAKMSAIRELQTITSMDGEDDMTMVRDPAAVPTDVELQDTMPIQFWETTKTQAETTKMSTTTNSMSTLTKITTEADATTTLIASRVTETNSGVKDTVMGGLLAACLIAAVLLL